MLFGIGKRCIFGEPIYQLEGKPVLHKGNWFRCRLLQVGGTENASNEWDKVLDETGENNSLWRWEEMYFWGADVSIYAASACAVRGYFSARSWCSNYATHQGVNAGFRPVLESLPSDNPTPNINLDGMDFQLTCISGEEGFCPILQPTQENVFKDISVGSKVRMYAFTEDGRPIHMDEHVKDPTKLTLTDRYYGGEYLVPWIISNGVAVASQSLKQ